MMLKRVFSSFLGPVVGSWQSTSLISSFLYSLLIQLPLWGPHISEPHVSLSPINTSQPFSQSTMLPITCLSSPQPNSLLFNAKISTKCQQESNLIKQAATAFSSFFPTFSSKFRSSKLLCFLGASLSPIHPQQK